MYCLYFAGSLDIGCFVLTPRCDISTDRCDLPSPVFLSLLMPLLLALALLEVADAGLIPPGGILNCPVEGRNFLLLSFLLIVI